MKHRWEYDIIKAIDELKAELNLKEKVPPKPKTTNSK